MTVRFRQTGLPRGRPLSEDDLEDMPDDGHRYELVDGVLIVTPGPSEPHQSAVVEVSFLLRSLARPTSRSWWRPFDVRLSSDTVVQPDVLVSRRRDPTRRRLPAAPVLAVEILPEHAADRPDAQALAVRGGRLPLLLGGDPDVPSVVAWELRDGTYVEAGRATGAEVLRLELPFAVEVAPARLDT